MPWDPNQSGSTAQADNQYGPSAPVTVLASAARTASGNQGNAGTATGGAAFLALMLEVTAASGTTPSLTVSVEWSNDGTTWVAADPADVFAARTATGRAVKSVAVKARLFRLVWTISGTTPSFTFSVSAYPVG